MKKASGIIVLLILSVLVVGGTSYAIGPYCCGGGQMQFANLDPDKQQAFDKLRIEFYESMTPLRSQMIQKQGELQALAVSPQANQTKTTSLSKEVGELQAKMIQKRVEFQNKVAKEIGFVPGGPGLGRGW